MYLILKTTFIYIHVFLYISQNDVLYWLFCEPADKTLFWWKWIINIEFEDSSTKRFIETFCSLKQLYKRSILRELTSWIENFQYRINTELVSLEQWLKFSIESSLIISKAAVKSSIDSATTSLYICSCLDGNVMRSRKSQSESIKSFCSKINC